MPWIKMETNLSDKPEVFFLAEKLKIDEDSVIGKLFRVWSWFDQNTTDGVTDCVTKALLDRLVHKRGFCDAMIEAKWMILAGDILFLPNYDRHNSVNAKTRALGAKRQARFKAKSND